MFITNVILVAAKGGRAHGTLLLEEGKAAGFRAALKQGAWADNRRLRAQAGHKSGLTGRNIGRRFYCQWILVAPKGARDHGILLLARKFFADFSAIAEGGPTDTGTHEHGEGVNGRANG